MGRNRRISARFSRACSRSRATATKGIRVDDGGTASASAKPVDHLAPGELLEGREKAFGVALPKGVAVEKRLVDVVYAMGSPPSAAVAKFFSTRVEGGKVTTGDRGTTFDGVHAPGNTNVTLRVEVATATDGPFAGRGSRPSRSETSPRPKQPDLPDESARWNAAGLTPDGKLADPKHMH